MRALIFELRPGNLENDGLLPALRTHTAALQGRIGLPVVVDERADASGCRSRSRRSSTGSPRRRSTTSSSTPAPARSSWRSTAAVPDVVLRDPRRRQGLRRGRGARRPSRADRDAGPGGQDRGDVSRHVAAGEGTTVEVVVPPGGDRAGRGAARAAAAGAVGRRAAPRSAHLADRVGGRHRRNDVARFGTSIPVERGVGQPTLRRMTDPAAAPAPLRVLLVDPDDRVRESLAGLLRIGRSASSSAPPGPPTAPSCSRPRPLPTSSSSIPACRASTAARPHRHDSGRSPRPPASSS